MSEKTPEELAAEAEKAAQQPTLEEQLAAAQADAEKWKGLSRKNEDRATENADKAKRYDASEDEKRTEIEKAVVRADAAEKLIADRDAAEASVKLRADIASEKGFEDRKIPTTALRGTTREELEAHADELLALFPAPPAAPSADGQGNVGDKIGDGELSAEDIVAKAKTR